MEKRLGKISGVSFGRGGYQDAMMGLALAFEGEGWGVGTFISAGWDKSIESGGRTKWTEKDRDAERASCISKIDDLLTKAKVDDVIKLKGKPVEVTFDGNILKDWRILTEVL